MSRIAGIRFQNLSKSSVLQGLGTAGPGFGLDSELAIRFADVIRRLYSYTRYPYLYTRIMIVFTHIHLRRKVSFCTIYVLSSEILLYTYVSGFVGIIK